jgi:Animal haem peroxidase
MTQHLIWMREHNRIEEQLWRLNPLWSGERLFQETRKIVIAIWQHVIYKEYLPIITGPQMMDVYCLTLIEEGIWNGMIPNLPTYCVLSESGKTVETRDWRTFSSTKKLHPTDGPCSCLRFHSSQPESECVIGMKMRTE